MEFLIQPDISYALLILGFLVAILALLAPGTGVLEVIALFTLALAAYGIVNLPVNLWALAIMAVGLIPLALMLGPLRQAARSRRNLLMILSMLAFLTGAVLLYSAPGQITAINPLLIIFITPIVIGLTWLIGIKTLEASVIRPAYNMDRLVGMTGQVTSDIRKHGTVYVDGEEWTALSSVFIPTGAQVRVIRREGLSLEVEPLE